MKYGFVWRETDLYAAVLSDDGKVVAAVGPLPDSRVSEDVQVMGMEEAARNWFQEEARLHSYAFRPGSPLFEPASDLYGLGRWLMEKGCSIAELEDFD